MLDAARTPGRKVLDALPLFPLPNVVLLPGMVLPLNVFEPRYRDLVDHVLDDGGHIGVPLLRPGYQTSYDGRPPIEPVLGIGKLSFHRELPDGRRFIRLEGLGRVEVIEELAPRSSFREVVCEALDEDLPYDRENLEVLKAQVERIASSLDDDDAEMVHGVLEIPDPRVMVYAVAAIVPNVDPTVGVDAGNGRCPRLELQQRCLDVPTTDDRVMLLLDRSDHICHELGESGAFPMVVLN